MSTGNPDPHQGVRHRIDLALFRQQVIFQQLPDSRLNGTGRLQVMPPDKVARRDAVCTSFGGADQVFDLFSEKRSGACPRDLHFPTWTGRFSGMLGK
jgi:hypothetical protein